MINKSWTIERKNKRGIRIIENGLTIDFETVTITGEKSLLKRLTNSKDLLANALYVDNKGKLPITLVLGINPKGQRRVDIKKILQQINNEELSRCVIG